MLATQPVELATSREHLSGDVPKAGMLSALRTPCCEDQRVEPQVVVPRELQGCLLLLSPLPHFFPVCSHDLPAQGEYFAFPCVLSLASSTITLSSHALSHSPTRVLS